MPSQAATLFWQGRYAEARDRVEAILARDPANAIARYQRAQIDLIEGRLAAAWPDYECRFEIPGWPGTRPPIPPWRGESLAGRTLVLTMEGGFGDLFQFIRFAPAAAASAGRLVTDLPAGVAWLFAGRDDRFGRILRAAETVTEVHRHCSVMSLPAVLGVTLGDLPQPPYLAADPARSAVWAARLAALPAQRRIGVVWRAGVDGDPGRSLPLDQLVPLAHRPGLALVSLQRDATAAERRHLGELGITWFADLDSGPDLFGDTAAILAQLDLVISVDTAVAHLAGAMGRPAWVLLKRHADWRWLLERTDSPWYPTLRLFRQREPGAWAPVVATVASALMETAGHQ